MRRSHSSSHVPRNRSLLEIADYAAPTRGVGENVSAITPHTLRRTYGSYLLNKGLRLEVVSKLLGHSSTVVTDRAYAELLGTTIRDELLAVLNAA